MNKLVSLILSLSISPVVCVAEGCSKVIPGYEESDTMYVVCEDLSGITQEESNKLIKNIFSQYKGEPDEVFVFFVSSKEYVGKFEFPAEVWVADYYTHHNKLTLWPKVKEKTRAITIQW